MKLIILTSSLQGTAAHHLQYLVNSKTIEIVMVVCSKGGIKNKKKYYRRKFKKMMEIGVFGTLNGIRMRKWYNEGTKAYLSYASLEKTCKQYNIPFKEVHTINCKETIQIFKEVNADLGLSLGNGYIGSKIFKTPKYGMLNVHHEILPAYQNAQSIIWQIFNGSKSTGYTIHKIDKNIDTGEIMYQEELPIVFRKTLSDTVSYNYASLWKASIKGLIKVIENFDYYNSNAQRQGKGGHYTTPNLRAFIKIIEQFRKLKNDQ